MTLEETLLDYIQERRENISFAELEWAGQQAGFDMRGDYAIQFKDSNAWAWMNMSQQFGQAIQRLLDAQRITLEPTHPMIYWVDADYVPTLPIAKRSPESHRYVKPHWLPVVVNAALN